MRRVLGVLCSLAVVACSDGSASGTDPFVSLESVVGRASTDHGDAHGPSTVFNTQMRSELEVPACATESKGHAQITVRPDGTIDSDVTLNNKGGESVRFGHIHHVTAPTTTGPIVWWLTSPVGTDLNLTDKHLQFRQGATFSATNGHFATHEEALAELLANPGDFYVNFHSDLCPPGFARGFLP